MVNLKGEPQCMAEQAMRWARSRGATGQFVNLAPMYWKYSEIYGIRPDVLYCQAAKETGFGRFGGAVTPDMHNFAGIKVKNPTGDAKDDHETFHNDEDGVEHHFIHMSAYVGGWPPKHKPHDRYEVVLKQSWAETVETVEGLSGKWAPSLDYGASIVRDYMQPMMAHESVTSCASCQAFEAEVKALKEKLAQIREIVG